MTDSFEAAPKNNLPDWKECSLRVENEKYLNLNKITDRSDSLLPSELHRFIYEYDDADPYKSAWFLHRLERLIQHVREEQNQTIAEQQMVIDTYRRTLKDLTLRIMHDENQNEVYVINSGLHGLLTLLGNKATR